MNCKKCGHKLPEDSEFCQYCGKKVKSGFAIYIKKSDYDNENQNFIKTKSDNKSQLKVKNEENVNNKKSKGIKINCGKFNFKAKGIIILSLAAVVILFITIISVNYSTVQEKAENVVAVYLVDKTMGNYSIRNKEFTSFEKTYYTVEVSGFKCVVKLSGAAHLRKQSESFPFSAMVKINLLSGETSISKLTLDGEKIK